MSLQSLKERFRVRNFCVSVKEQGEDIIFLRKIIAGGTDRSYGVHVAKLAGVPRNVVDRANEILENLNSGNVGVSEDMDFKYNEKPIDPMVTFINDFKEEMDTLDVNNMTPFEAIRKLYDIKEKLKNLK